MLIKSQTILKGESFLGDNKYINSYYTWQDQEYREFMTTLLMSLRPMQADRRTVLVEELDEFTEITFIHSGKVLIGFELNRQKHYCISYKDCCVIGAYGMTFKKRAQFVYTTQTAAKGFFIRKASWCDLMDSNKNIGYKFKQNILTDYWSKILIKVRLFRRRATEKVMERNDYQEIK